MGIETIIQAPIIQYKNCQPQASEDSLQRHQSFALQTPRWSDSESFLHYLQQSTANQNPDDIRKPLSFVPVHLIPQDTIQGNWQSFRDTFEQSIDCLEHDSTQEILGRESFLKHYQNEENWIFSLDQDEKEKDIAPLTLVTQEKLSMVSQELFIRSSTLDCPPQGFVFTRVELWPLSILRDVQMASRKAVPHMAHPIPIILSGAIPIDGEERSLHLQDYTMQEMLDDLKGRSSNQKNYVRPCTLVEIPSVVPFIEETTDIRRRVSPIETQLRQVWGSFVKELRIIFNLLSAQRQLYNRILQLARRPLPTNQNDQVLAESGLGEKIGLTTHIRSPIMSRIF